jgi:VWFA-related protein
VAVERVAVPLVVRDARGEFIYNLNRGELTLFDNGVPQQLSSFEAAGQPLSLVILVSTSRKLAPLLNHIRQTGILFTSYVVGQFGEAAVISFDSDIKVRQNFTADPESLIQAMEQLSTGGAQSRLADAMSRAIDLLVERPEGRRRVIIVLADPLDDGSSTPMGIPLRLAQLANISIYTIGLDRFEAELRRRPEDTPLPPPRYPPGIVAGPQTPGSVTTPTSQAQEQYARLDLLNAVMFLVRSAQTMRGKDTLEVYSYGTGGIHQGVFGQRSLEEAVNRIGQDLHNQYLLTYRPSNRAEEGFHRIQVSVARPGTLVRTRPGYYVGPAPLKPLQP